MIFSRLAFITLDGTQKGLEKTSICINNFHIDVLFSSEQPLSSETSKIIETIIGIRATTEVSSCHFLIEDNELLIPEALTKSCNKAIEEYGACLSVYSNNGISITSPETPIRLYPQWLADRKILKKVKTYKKYTNSGRVKFKTHIDGLHVFEELTDRLNGVKLLSEAITATTPTGKYKNYVRLFELGFGAPFTVLVKKLTKFIDPSFKISRADIQSWIDIRHPITHADKKKTDFIAFDSDVDPFITEMESAAYDVLFNKKNWQNKSTERREILNTINKPRDGEEASLTLTLTLKDHFNSFPLNMSQIRFLHPGWPKEQEFQNHIANLKEKKGNQLKQANFTTIE